jgi:hypothetical protein
MQTNIDLVLDLEVGLGQQGQQLGYIGGNLIPEVTFDEAVPVEGRRSERCVGRTWSGLRGRGFCRWQIGGIG